jgi:plasmid stabilization system protein ParE
VVYRVVYTKRALDDLAEIVGYLAEDSADAASSFGEAFIDHIELLAQFPQMGDLIGKRSKVRRLLHSPVIVYYRADVRGHKVEVLHIRDASRRGIGF